MIRFFLFYIIFYFTFFSIDWLQLRRSTSKPEILSEQWLVQVGLSLRFHGNHFNPMGACLLEIHTPNAW